MSILIDHRFSSVKTREKKKEKKLQTRLQFVRMSRKKKMTKPLIVVFFDMQTYQ
jgi:hypothetical protein